jgi:hypothetical protein
LPLWCVAGTLSHKKIMPAKLVEKLNSTDAPIVSTVTFAPLAENAAGTESTGAALAAFADALAEAHDGEYAALPASAPAPGFIVPTRWEPPFKVARAVSAKFRDVRISVVADAFRDEYWLARAVFEGGRAVVDETLTLNDGAEFDALFEQLHGEPYAVWRTKNKQSGLRGGFSWGTSDDYDPSKSELGKAEGQA